MQSRSRRDPTLGSIATYSAGESATLSSVSRGARELADRRRELPALMFARVARVHACDAVVARAAACLPTVSRTGYSIYYSILNMLSCTVGAVPTGCAYGTRSSRAAAAHVCSLHVQVHFQECRVSHTRGEQATWASEAGEILVECFGARG